MEYSHLTINFYNGNGFTCSFRHTYYLVCIKVLKDDVASFNNKYYIKKSRYNSAESSQLSKLSHRLLDSLVV